MFPPPLYPPPPKKRGGGFGKKPHLCLRCSQRKGKDLERVSLEKREFEQGVFFSKEKKEKGEFGKNILAFQREREDLKGREGEDGREFPPPPVSSPSQREGEDLEGTPLYPPPPGGRGRIKEGEGEYQSVIKVVGN